MRETSRAVDKELQVNNKLFLNPDRISMPDIDVDFEFEYRENVIDYCKMKYGEECVSRIITFGTMAAKGAIIDMTRVLDKPVSLSRKISELIPSAPGMTIEKAMLTNPDLVELYNNDTEVKEVVDLAKKVEGLIKNTSCHACGVIIAPDDVTKFCPQTFALDEDTGKYERTTQYTMGECEEIGLLKMDFLGLRTESVIKEAVLDIEKYHGIKLNPYDVRSIAMDDVNVYGGLLAKGRTVGVFQLESDGLTSVIKQLYEDVATKVKEIEDNPMLTEEGKHLAKLEFGNQCFERLIAGISLYRPGPMDEIPKYIDGMRDESKIVYDCPQLKPILQNTYGVIVYQEQVMLAVRALAGFTAGQSDTIRKGMGKKKQEILDEYKPFFINGSGNAIDGHTNQLYGIKGCVDNGIDETVAGVIWDKMESFAKYAFNKSHAAAYAVVAIQTAWLAYYYPTIFMKANLNVYKGNPDKLSFYLGYCNKVGIKVLPPSVNDSDFYFTLNDDASAIVFGLSGIKNVGKTAQNIMNERSLRGKFTSFQNFIERMLKYWGLNSRAVESLAKTGALDCFGGSRKSKIDYAAEMIEIIKKDKSFVYPGHSTIYDMGEEFNMTFEMSEMKNISVPNDDIEYDKDTLLALEEEFGGFYLSGHPLDEYETILKKQNFMEISKVIEEVPSTKITIAGVLSNIENKVTQKGSRFAKVVIKDKAANLSCVIWEKYLNSYGEKIKNGAKVLVTGYVEKNDFGVQFTITSIVDLDDLKNQIKGLKVIASLDTEQARDQYRKAYALASKHVGDMMLVFWNQSKPYPLPAGNWSCELLAKLQDVFGEENVKYISED